MLKIEPDKSVPLTLKLVSFVKEKFSRHACRMKEQKDVTYTNKNVFLQKTWWRLWTEAWNSASLVFFLTFG